MKEEIIINGLAYSAKYTDDEVLLRRFDDKSKMWITLHYPKTAQNNSDSVIEMLSNYYVRKNVFKGEIS